MAFFPPPQVNFVDQFKSIYYQSTENPPQEISEEYLNFFKTLPIPIPEEELAQMLKESGGIPPAPAELINMAYGMLSHFTQQIIESLDLVSILTALNLDLAKSSQLSNRKLNMLLMTTIEVPTLLGGVSPKPAIIGELFRCLQAAGVSFDTLATIEDSKFQMLISGADRLIQLHQTGINLSRLLDLSYPETYALLLPPEMPRSPTIISAEDAIALLQTPHFALGI